MMADSIDIQQRRRGEEEPIDVVEIQIDRESDDDNEPDGADKPPDYTAVLEEEGVGRPTVDGENGAPPPLSYDVVMAAETHQSQPTPSTKVLTAEAPPSYLQLFGKEETDVGVDRSIRHHRRLAEEGGGEERRRGHWRLLNLLPTNTRSANKCGAVMMLLIFLTVISLCMIVVGVIHYNNCSVQEVPLFLIVGGIFLLVEIILHSLFWTAQKLSEKPIYGLIRRFDCIALFLVIWLVVGSAWVFKARTDFSSDSVDFVILPANTTTGDDLEMYDSGVSNDAAYPDDCPQGVYVFTVFLILFQYIMILLLGICCCTSSVRHRRH